MKFGSDVKLSKTTDRHKSFVAALVMLFVATIAFAEDFSDWQKSMAISFPGYTEDETLYNFPVLIVLEETDAGSGFHYSDFLSPPYEDLRFVASDKVSLLDFEVESWDDEGKSYVWVKIPELTSSTTIYALWGKEDVVLPSCATDGSVWSENFEGVWHMNQVDAQDSSANKIHAVAYGGVVATDGIVGGADELNGSTSYLNVTDCEPLESQELTVSLWLKPEGPGTHPDRVWVLTKGRAQGNGDLSYGIAYSHNLKQISARISDGTAQNILDPSPVSVGEWIHVAISYVPGELRLYRDGELHVTLREGSNIYYDHADPDLHIGDWGYGNTTRRFEGVIDELQISSVARSAKWIRTCWKNQGVNGEFVSYGSPVHKADPIVSNDYGASSVTYDSAILNGTLVSTGEYETAVTVFWDDHDAGTDEDAWNNCHTWDAPQQEGDLSHEITGLDSDQIYYYRFKSENLKAEFWSESTSVFVTSDVWMEKISDAHFLGFVPGEVIVCRQGTVTDVALDVRYSVGGTAVPGQDYAELPGVVTIPAGQTQVSISIQPLLTADESSSKNVRLELVSGAYVKGDPSIIEVKIVAENYNTWAKSMAITFSGYTQTETLYDFPALVVLEETGSYSGFRYSDFLSPSCADLRFLADDKATLLDFEVESWDDEGKSYVWVKVPELTSSTTIYAFWGKEGAVEPSSELKKLVWNNNYAAVWHMNQVNALDSTVHGIHALAVGPVVEGEGIINGANDLDGNTAILNVTNCEELEPYALTFSMWFQPKGPGTHADRAWVLTKGRAAGQGDLSYGLGYSHNTKVLTIRVSDKTSLELSDSSGIETGEWVYAVVSYTPGDLRYYRDGVMLARLQTGGAIYYDHADPDLHIGDYGRATFTRRFQGAVDELRISSVVRSADWIWAKYQNIANNASFCSYDNVVTHQVSGSIYVFR